MKRTRSCCLSKHFCMVKRATRRYKRQSTGTHKEYSGVAWSQFIACTREMAVKFVLPFCFVLILIALIDAKKHNDDSGYCMKSDRGEAHITEWTNTTVDINYTKDVNVTPEDAAKLREGTRKALERYKRSNTKAEKKRQKKRKNRKARKDKKAKQQQQQASSTAAPEQKSQR
ncbi:hypothetical protein M3Y96_00969000 [Aphelenchoides besseyi]|nr:hypothetical protein M3Y96_00969000 [Aphelenchoides besseyi]